MQTDKKLLGRWGEDIAGEYLKKHGYQIIGRNYGCRFGEIDIIAEKRKFIVFVEVKLRKDDRFASAAEFVTAEKQRRIIAAAQMWLTQNENEKQPRFDVVEIYAPEGIQTKEPKINHIEDAFQT
jgi:putative endonuclease